MRHIYFFCLSLLYSTITHAMLTTIPKEIVGHIATNFNATERAYTGQTCTQLHKILPSLYILTKTLKEAHKNKDDNTISRLRMQGALLPHEALFKAIPTDPKYALHILKYSQDDLTPEHKKIALGIAEKYKQEDIVTTIRPKINLAFEYNQFNVCPICYQNYITGWKFLNQKQPHTCCVH